MTRPGSQAATRGDREAAVSSGMVPPFFVVGSDRSGTTMFRLMLNAHSRMHVPPETWFLTDLMDQFAAASPLGAPDVSRAIEVITGHWRWRDWGIDDAALRGVAEALTRPTLRTLLDAMYRLAAGEKPRWGDKTPGYVREVTRLHAVFPDAKFIHVIRDARDVAVSLRRTGWRGDVTWSIATYWDEFVGAGCRQGRALPAGHYLEVRYDDLVLETEATLRRVCEFLDEPFETAMLSFHEGAADNLPEGARRFHTKTGRAPQASDLDRWRKELTGLQTQLVEAGAWPTMRLVGQSLAYPVRARVLRPLLRAVGWAAVTSLPLRRRLGLHFPRLRGRF